MPTRAKKVCKKYGCPNTHNNTNSYCDEHQLPTTPTKDDRPNSTDRGYDYKWKKFRNKVMKGTPLCVRCGQPAEVLDHIIPIQIMKEIYGGNTYRKEHYQPLCKKCNDLKGKREDKQMIEDFFRDRELNGKEDRNRVPKV